MRDIDNSFGRVLVIVASLVIILAGVKIAAPIIVPFLLSLFMAIILMPSLSYMIKKRIPISISLVVIVVVLVLILSLLGALVGHAVNDFTLQIPLYEQKLQDKLVVVTDSLGGFGVNLQGDSLKQMLDPAVIFGYMSGVLKGFGSTLANGFVILLTTIFMMLEGVQFKKKIAYINQDRPHQKSFSDVVEKIKHYMALKAVMSAVTGILVYAVLLLFGLDYAVLWAVLAFLLNFIPNIGSIIAAVPAVMLAILQLDLMSAIWIGTSYIVINTVVGSIVEPRIMGKGLDISTLVVFLSLIFWGWLLGPVGMLLSIPLTIMVKLFCASNPHTQWVAVMLGEAKR